MADILIIDDDEPMRDALAEAVRDLGHRPHLAPTGGIALDMLARDRMDAALLDLRMPGLDGIEVLRRISERVPGLPVTVLTAHATAGNTIEAMRLGAFDHVTKPIHRAELERVLAGMLANAAKPALPPVPPAEEGLIGNSHSIRAVQKMIGLLADADTNVLISGETGTGKELVARALHEHGRRRGRPFIAVNCAAIPGELLESELFGHVRGAFTGAVADRLGAFREAGGGTLFLDEIGDMDLALQAKILRVLQERVVTPVAGKPVAVDVRVLAATHRDLSSLVRERRFREDLYYRLNVVPIRLAPLRERIADIMPLAEHFLRHAGGKTLAADAAARLVAYPWPGNVRELRNAMERVSALVYGDRIAAADLAFLDAAAVSGGTPPDCPDEDLPTALARLEEMLIRRALVGSGGNRAEAARRLNIHRQLLYTKMKRYGLDLSGDRTDPVVEADGAAPAKTENT